MIHSLPSSLRIAAAVLAAVILGVVGGLLLSGSGGADQRALATNAELDPGTPLHGAAADFTLRDEADRPVSLHSFRGKVVLLAFNDSRCTTICPLTTTAMLDAQSMLGPAARGVQLLGIDANPAATSVRDVRLYTESHGMTGRWRFLTGSLAQLRHVWRSYNIDVAVEQGQIDHTPALFVIDRRGRLQRLYLTQQSYAAVGQLGQLLAHEVASLLPGHPAVRSHLSYARITGIPPSRPVLLPRTGGGSVMLGPSATPHLLLFFASWDQEVTDLRRQLRALERYRATAAARRLPAVMAVDEASVEPDPAALERFLGTLPRPPAFPIALDRSGRIADGYGVQDEPWLVLVSAAGRILWYHDVATDGWPSAAALARQLRAALARVPGTAAGAALAGSPPPLAAIHAQAGKLLGNTAALAARLKALRGHPVVVNAWASWCGPCRAEFGLFAQAADRYGRRVAFLGADTDDQPSDAGPFLAGHPVSYPSYQTTRADITRILPQGLVGVPTTIFIDGAGRIVFVHSGQYDSQGSLDSEIESYALGG